MQSTNIMNITVFLGGQTFLWHWQVLGTNYDPGSWDC